MGLFKDIFFDINSHIRLYSVFLPTNQFRLGEQFRYTFRYVADADYQVDKAYARLMAKEWIMHYDAEVDGDGGVTTRRNDLVAFLYDMANSQDPGPIGPTRPYDIDGSFIIPINRGPSIHECLQWYIESIIYVKGHYLARSFPITVLPIILLRKTEEIGRDYLSPATSTVAQTGPSVPPPQGPDPEVIR